MKGSTMISILAASSLAVGGGLWYTQNYAYYETVEGITSVTAYGDAFPVSNYTGIDADTSPLKMRACFTVDWDYFPTDEFKDIATPLVAPSWFECFDAEQISKDLQAGNASAILSDENQPYGFDTYIAQYPDGAAFMWRQINVCGEAVFAGNDLPENCPPPPAKGTSEASKSSLGIDVSDELEIKLASGVGTYDSIPVTNPMVLADIAKPEGFQACFEVDMSLAFISETYEIVENVSPQITDTSLPCFDAQRIIDDVQSGAAMAVRSEKQPASSLVRMIAVYDDGRAYAWHQKVVN